MPARQQDRPKRRLAPRGEIDPRRQDLLVDRVRYSDNANHKRSAADYGFHLSANPRPPKSLCDGGGRRPKHAEAQAPFREGLKRGRISSARQDGFPKYVWAVDSEGRASEAKLGSVSEYRGYVLGEDDDGMRRLVVREWRSRCPID